MGKGKGEKGVREKVWGKERVSAMEVRDPHNLIQISKEEGPEVKPKVKADPPSTAAVLVCFACQASGMPNNHDYRSCPASLAVLAAKIKKMMQGKEAQDNKMSEASSSNNPPQQ